MKCIQLILISILLFSNFSAVFAQEDLPVYSAELFYIYENSPDFYTAPAFGKQDSDEENQNEKEILKEAVFLFSGMLYGFNFEYIPGDKRRGVEEVFEINLINTIPRGDPRLKIRGTRYEDSRTWVSFAYYPDEKMRSWIMYWSSGSVPVIGGKAEGAFFEGYSGKEDAVKKGVKEAVRNYMRKREHNKPQKIEGEFAFAAPPVFSYSGGIYTASVKVKMNIKKVSAYKVY